MALAPTQPILRQGDAGFSRKGPEQRQASHYVSLPQLPARLTLEVNGQPPLPLGGRAWLDHEWSDEILHPEAVGWDWIGINLFDGGALTAFVLRRRDGSPLWAGGSWHAAASTSGPGRASTGAPTGSPTNAPTRAPRPFAPDEVRSSPVLSISDPIWWNAFLGGMVVSVVSVVLTLILKDELKGRKS